MLMSSYGLSVLGLTLTLEILWTASMPFVHLPNTVCLLSSQGCRKANTLQLESQTTNNTNNREWVTLLASAAFTWKQADGFLKCQMTKKSCFFGAINTADVLTRAWRLTEMSHKRFPIPISTQHVPLEVSRCCGNRQLLWERKLRVIYYRINKLKCLKKEVKLLFLCLIFCLYWTRYSICWLSYKQFLRFSLHAKLNGLWLHIFNISAGEHDGDLLI